MKDNPKLLQWMIEDEASADPIYRPGPYWRPYQRRALAAIAKHGIKAFRGIPGIGKGFADTPMLDPFEARNTWKQLTASVLVSLPPMRQLVPYYKDLIRTQTQTTLLFKSIAFQCLFGDLLDAVEQDHGMLDTLHGGTRDIVHINEKPYSTPYVRAIARLSSFQAQGMDFERVSSFMEIGGGFGGTTHLILHLYPNIRKVIYLDIPPMIYIGTEYLRHFFSDAVRDYGETRTLGHISFRPDNSLEILCVCPWQLPKVDVSNLDFLYNVASFSEMTSTIVDNYGRQANRILGADANLLMVLNKLVEDGRPNMQVCVPEKVLDAFSPGFACETFEPRWELPQHPRYVLGKRTEPGRA